MGSHNPDETIVTPILLLSVRDPADNGYGGLGDEIETVVGGGKCWFS